MIQPDKFLLILRNLWKNGDENMRPVYCPVKKKNVYITSTRINVGNLNNPNEAAQGLIECSDNDYLCDDNYCPIQNGDV